MDFEMNKTKNYLNFDPLISSSICIQERGPLYNSRFTKTGAK